MSLRILRFLTRKTLYFKLLEIIEKHCVSTIVDVGCGAGHFISITERYYVTKQHKWVRLIGIDINYAVLEYAKRASEHSLFINADMFSLPLRDDSVDCVFFSHVIEHIIDPRSVFEEFKRILTKRGCLVITPTYHRWFFTPGHVRPYTIDRLKETLGEGGYEVIFVGYSHTLFLRRNSRLIKELINIFPLRSFKEVIIAIASKR